MRPPGSDGATTPVRAVTPVEEGLQAPLAAVEEALRSLMLEASSTVRKQELEIKRLKEQMLRGSQSSLTLGVPQPTPTSPRAPGAAGGAVSRSGSREVTGTRTASREAWQTGCTTSRETSPQQSQIQAIRAAHTMPSIVPTEPVKVHDIVEDTLRDAVRDDGAHTWSICSPGSHVRPKRSRRSAGSQLSGVRRSISDATGRVLDSRQYRNVFPTAEGMKERISLVLFNQRTTTVDLYKDEGLARRLATSVYFDYFTLFVIFLNTIWIAVDVDHNLAKDPRDAETQFVVMDNIFCAFFLFEILVRLDAFRVKSDSLKDPWFLFDGVLVITTIIDTWVMMAILVASDMEPESGGSTVIELFRLLRLARMTRMIRIIRAVPQLVVILKGMAAAAKSVLLTLCLLMVVIYVFAILLRQITKGTAVGEQYFSSVPAAMSSLLLQGTLPDQADFVTDAGNASWVYGVCVMAFILLGTLTVMNMLIGILVQVVSVVAAAESEEMTIASVRASIAHILEKYGVDVNGDGAISRHEFEQLLQIPEGLSSIQKIGVDALGLVDYIDFIFEGHSRELSFDELFQLLLQLRSRNQATVKDIVDLRKFVFQVVQNPQSVASPSVERIRGSIRASIRASSPLPFDASDEL